MNDTKIIVFHKNFSHITYTRDIQLHWKGFYDSYTHNNIKIHNRNIKDMNKHIRYVILRVYMFIHVTFVLTSNIYTIVIFHR